MVRVVLSEKTDWDVAYLHLSCDGIGISLSSELFQAFQQKNIMIEMI
jgi:hypothetical protein